jgi:soluble lytic murein transglycosylase
VTVKKAFPDIHALSDDTIKKYEQFKDLILLGFYNYAEQVLLHLRNTAPKKDQAWLAYELARFYSFNRKPELAIRAIAGSQLYYNFICRQPQNPPPSEFYKIYYPELYHEWIVQETTKNDIPDPHLVKALIYHESRYNPNAISSRGAIGLLQVMPEVLGQYRHESGEKDLAIDDLFDPYINIQIGCYKLNKNIEELHHLIPALLSYNADIKKVKQWIPYTSGLPFDIYIEQVPFIQTQVFFKRVYETYCDYLRIYGGGKNFLN